MGKKNSIYDELVETLRPMVAAQLKKIIVLDYNSGNVYTFDFATDVFDPNDMAEFFEFVNETFELELQEDKCKWMIVDKLVIINN